MIGTHRRALRLVTQDAFTGLISLGTLQSVIVKSDRTSSGVCAGVTAVVSPCRPRDS